MSKKKDILRKPICNGIQFGEWKETDADGISLETITRNQDDAGVKLDGLIISGAETLHANGTNTNYERYSKDALDKFINDYFVAKNLNLPVDVEHDGRPEWLVGRVIMAEANEQGFFFTAYVPRQHPKFEYIKLCLQEGLLQGFSKMGWATKWKPEFDDNGQWLYDKIEEFELVRMSLVATPANGIAFEEMREAIKNGLRYKKRAEKQNGINALFV